MSIDPYSSPATHAQPPSFSAGSAVSQGVVAQLAGTKPWVRFISVLMFLGAGLMLILGVVMVLMGGVIASASNNQMFAGGMGVVLAAIYIVMAAFYIYPALKLWKYANSIGALMSSGSVLDLETALSQQRSFWKFIGIIFLVFVSLYALIFIGAIVLGGIGAMTGRN